MHIWFTSFKVTTCSNLGHNPNYNRHSYPHHPPCVLCNSITETWPHCYSQREPCFLCLKALIVPNYHCHGESPRDISWYVLQVAICVHVTATTILTIVKVVRGGVNISLHICSDCYNQFLQCTNKPVIEHQDRYWSSKSLFYSGRRGEI